MKKEFFTLAMFALALTSCTTIKKTATSVDVANTLRSVSEADLEISNTRITYTFRPEAKERRGGAKNVELSAVRAALKNNDNADVLVAPEFETRIRKGLFRKKIKEVTVTGYPAKYKNFRVVNK